MLVVGGVYGGVPDHREGARRENQQPQAVTSASSAQLHMSLSAPDRVWFSTKGARSRLRTHDRPP